MVNTALKSKRYEAGDYAEVNEMYHSRGWTDGLPIVPPTEEAVLAFVEIVRRQPSEVLGNEPVRGKVITVEKAAINAVMAGCRAEYFPVVLAAVEAMCQPQFNLHAITASTMGAAILAVVNGPIVKQMGMNSGINLFGQGNRANATIGRALRLIAINAVGAVPGGLDKATLGHPGKYAYCIAEAEDVSPWEPLHVERGLSSNDSAVTVFAGMAPWQMTNHAGNMPEAVLTTVADVLRATSPRQGEVLVVLSPEHVAHIERAGWSKRQVKEYLYRKAHRTAREWFEAGRLEMRVPPKDGDEMIGACSTPDAINVVVGGGPAGGFSAVVPMWASGIGSRSATCKVNAVIQS